MVLFQMGHDFRNEDCGKFIFSTSDSIL